MKIKHSQLGFENILHPSYAESPELRRLVSQSSAIDENPYGPGSSFLWIGLEHHLNRDEVQDLVLHLQAWLKTGSLVVGGNAATHTLYTDADPDKPDSILDCNGEVVLGLCKVCGAAERELDEKPCNSKPKTSKK